MEKKLIYFDIDGTIFDFQNGILNETKNAIKKLIENGHYVCLCSGRSRARIYDDIFMDFGIQGVIASGGAYIEWKGKVLRNVVVSPKIADYAVDVLRKNNFVPVLDGPEYVYYDAAEYTPEVDYYQELIEKKLGDKRKSISENTGNLHINKISAKKRENHHEKNAIQKLQPWFRAIVHKGITVEFVPNGYSKGEAAVKLAEYLHVSKENTFGFGDSMNDLELFKEIGHGVAMGNAVKELQDEAEFVTHSRLNSGVPYALRHYELI